MLYKKNRSLYPTFSFKVAKKDKQLLNDFYSLGRNLRIDPLLKEAYNYQRAYKKIELDLRDVYGRAEADIRRPKILETPEEEPRIVELSGTPLKEKEIRYEVLIKGRESIPTSSIQDIHVVLKREGIGIPALSTFKTKMSKKFSKKSEVDIVKGFISIRKVVSKKVFTTPQTTPYKAFTTPKKTQTAYEKIFTGPKTKPKRSPFSTGKSKKLYS